MATCLIADDSQIVRKILRRILEDYDFTCTECENGTSALENIIEQQPDLVILDYQMPGMNGMDVLKQIRLSRKIKQPRIIFCSIDDSVETMTQAINAGADEYIMKPFDSDIVRGRLLETGLIE